MKLTPDCVRDILLTIEDNEFGNCLTLDDLCEKLPNYTQNEIHYACLKLNEGGYLDSDVIYMCGQSMPGILVNDLTFTGHEFLENIKSPSNWSKIMNGCKKVGTFSLPFVKEIAVQVIKKSISDGF
jgi:hypothetical protein